jgi:hypothetical protein
MTQFAGQVRRPLFPFERVSPLMVQRVQGQFAGQRHSRGRAVAVPYEAHQAVRFDSQGDPRIRNVVGHVFHRAIAGFPVATRAASNLLSADHEQRGPNHPDGFHALWDEMGGTDQHVVGLGCPGCCVAGQTVSGSFHPEYELAEFVRAMHGRFGAQQVVGVPIDWTSPRSIYLHAHGYDG